MIPPGLSLVISLIRFVLKQAKEVKTEMQKEIDNLIYAGIAIALTIVVMSFKLEAGLTMASGLFGALLIKIKDK